MTLSTDPTVCISPFLRICELFEVREDTVSAIRERSHSIGKKVKYTVGDEVFEGIISDITNTGAAELTLTDGTVKEIFCGEITQ